MINKKVLPVGSYVAVYGSSVNLMVCQVIEVLRNDTVRVVIFGQTQDDGRYKTGKIYPFPLASLEGISCLWFHLSEFGFTDSDEKGWNLVYWFGTDMKLLYRADYKKEIAYFRFKNIHRKSYVRISCRYIHELQNIMCFLTGGELEFEYKKLQL